MILKLLKFLENVMIRMGVVEYRISGIVIDFSFWNLVVLLILVVL